ncbi:MAG: indolepyruvate ferredoxin oxidoreductase family protein [Betaproteobacteria bacterium]|nr:MAG: indolepyruvate ferredoxin oxidoreductase family protein [Betaproteobacteria bacterium]
MLDVTLDDKYVSTDGHVYLTGIQALVRLMLVQRQRDALAGLNTAGFVSGYRGSPLGGLDKTLWKARSLLESNHIKFQPGVNEELAATAVWGTQQLHITGDSDYDGVFAMWYGKGPGVDRCGDVFKHMNFAGTARHGGVLLIAGDDHGAYSSSLPHQSDHLFSASMIPVLYPCNVSEYMELGLHGIAMSRFSGCAVGFKALADTVESSATIDASIGKPEILLPEDFDMPEGGLNCQWSSDGLRVQARKQEALMQDYKIYAALAYSRANRLNRTTIDSPNARLGIVASGKSYMDVLEALEELGIAESQAATIGIRLFKVSMPWPLEPDGIREFSRGLDEILVVEEKRQLVEYQLKEQLYNWDPDVRPRIIGKFDDKGEWVPPRGEWLLPAKSDFSIAQIARVIASRIARFHQSDLIKARLTFLDAKEAALQKTVDTPPRPAWYCSGCPHNTSTKVPQGSLALGGIGCHIMATAIYPNSTKTFCHMGGEGASWIGQAPFSKRNHVFANLGDGTYFHSGLLAIRAAQAANVNITYKLLYNDAVAMTGGQPIDGTLTVPMIAQQLAGEGIKRIVVVSEDVSRYSSESGLPSTVPVYDRSGLDQVQKELREVPGVSVLIYDQTCAAEKRRRRKKGELETPTKRLFINEAVCEGCGDCGVQSNCVSLLPLETEFGRKRMIDQSACNQDYSCVKGFCPSFVTVNGGKPRKQKKSNNADQTAFPPLPQPELPQLTSSTYNILINGIGGTGVITVGALLGMATHLEGKGASALDMTGMSQKNAAVTSHVRIARAPEDIRAQRIAAGEADLILGCDMLTAGAWEALAKTRAGRTVAIINSHEQPTGHFAQNADWTFPTDRVRDQLEEAVDGKVHFVDATRIATALMGDSIATNLFMLGFAFQKGLIPLTEDSLIRAIELNGVAVDANKHSFLWGRRAAFDLKAVERVVAPAQPVIVTMPETLDKLVERRAEFLTAYQNAAYARRYRDIVEKVRASSDKAGLDDSFAKMVAKNLFKLMAYKDEYEVARLYSDRQFEKRLRAAFEGNFSIKYNLAPPFLAKRDSNGQPVKAEYGAWMKPVFALLARLKWLRQTAFDPFGHTEERKAERQLIRDYESTIDHCLQVLSADNGEIALKLASLPEHVRGFGHVKADNVEAFYRDREALLCQLNVSTLVRAA